MGDNSKGQLGRTGNPSLPQKVEGLPFILAIAAGESFSACLGTDYKVYTFGANNRGQLGHGTYDVGGTTPQVVSNLYAVTAIACSDNTVVATVAYNNDIYGTIELEGIEPSAKPQHATFSFQDAGTTNEILLMDVLINADGTFHIVGAPPGDWDIHIKLDSYLGIVVGVDNNNGIVRGVVGYVPAGDSNNDNFVDVLDLATLITAFGTDTTMPEYDKTADFNSDEYVDVLDLSLLINNFGGEGAP